MSFPDYEKFGGENRSSVKHETVLSYLRNYTNHYNLRKYIKFDTLVEKVTPILGNRDWQTTKWRVQTRNVIANRIDVTICNAVIICSGRYSKMNIPKIPGIQTFSGRTLHSHKYRRPEGFANQNVVLLGAGTSGIDIALDLSPYAKHIYLSHRHDKIKGQWPENIEQVRGVVSAMGKSVILQDNTSITADILIYCTGYNFGIPFVDESSGLVIEDKRIYPLYKYMVNARHPSMAIFDMPNGILLHFSIFYIQAKYYSALLRNKINLPSLEDRLKKAPKTNDLPDGQWIYYRKLASEAGFESVPRSYEKAFDAWNVKFKNDAVHFKDNELIITNDTVRIVDPRKRITKIIHE